jgi:membrane glycosyltransferase
MQRRHVLLAALMMGAAALLGSSPALPAASEYQVKAVFLFNFARFVDWPAVTFVSASAPFTLCVYGDDPFGPDLDAVVRGESIGGRPMRVWRVQELRDVAQCQIVFIAGSADHALEEVVAALDQHATLTVSDLEGAARRGAMVSMMTVNGRIRLRINIDAVRAAHLSMSSNLLRAAEIVNGAAPREGA